MNSLLTADSRFLWNDPDVACFLPAFCDDSAIRECMNVTISNCTQCSRSRQSLLLFFVLTIGFLALIGNMLTISVGVHQKKKKISRKINVFRSSLALADLLIGVQLMIVVLYNYTSVVNSIGKDVLEKNDSLVGSSFAIFAGVLNLFTYTSSLYHLLLIGIQRLMAIYIPIQYKKQSKSTIYFSLAATWLLSGISASVPAWFPNTFSFSYYGSSFLYWPVLKGDSLKDVLSPAIGSIFFFYILPFIVMTVLTVLSAVILQKNFKTTKQLSNAQFKHDSSFKSRNMAAFKTIFIMQLAFTITIIPLVTVFLLFYVNSLDCHSVSIPYVVCFYFSMTNSILNVIIYSIRDQSFRTSTCRMFGISHSKEQSIDKVLS